jgi:hypothetical protein
VFLSDWLFGGVWGWSSHTITSNLNSLKGGKVGNNGKCKKFTNEYVQWVEGCVFELFSGAQ